MPRVRIIKKNDEYSSEYDLGDIFEITGTWYGGVHIEGKSGVPVSLDKDEYMELDTEPQEQKNPAAGDVTERDILVGDIVQHFKREWVSSETSEYFGILIQGSSICAAYGDGREAGRLSGDVSAVQDMCQTV